MPDVDERPAESEAWSEEHVTDRLRELFAIQLNIRVPSDDTDLLESGLLDSLGLVELLFQVEQTFGLTLHLDELDVEHFRSLRTIGATVTAWQCATLGQLPPVDG
jgi:acyl carrier protein